MADEASPFNLCAHAYLAATRDALLRLQALRPEDAGVARLVRRIEGEMIAEGAALTLCTHSAAEFGTAQVIGPDWRAVPGHAPSLAALAIIAGLAGAGGWALRRPAGAAPASTG